MSPHPRHLSVSIYDGAEQFPGAPSSVHPYHPQDLEEPEGRHNINYIFQLNCTELYLVGCKDVKITDINYRYS